MSLLRQVRGNSLRLLCGSFALLCVGYSSAQADGTRGTSNMPSDIVLPNGPLPASAAIRSWHLDKQGNIFDKNNHLVGRVEGDGSIVACDKTIVGRINRDMFTDPGGQVKATLSEDGALYNDMGAIIAWVTPHDRIAAAFILFSPQLRAHRLVQ